MGKRWALVTGASSGIGYAYARALARRGYCPLIVSNEEGPLMEKAGELRRDFPGVEVEAAVSDLARPEAAAELHELCRERGMEVEVLVNNAGVYHDRDFLDDTAEFTRLILTLHMVTPALLAHRFGRDMAARGRGYILNMSSVTSNFGIQRMSTYSSTKGFLRLFSRSAHIELRDKGVTVTCVRPGAVATPLYHLSDRAMRTGLALGAIVTPEWLAERGVRAMLRGKHEVTPGLFTKLLGAVALLPVCVMRMVRKRGWF